MASRTPRRGRAGGRSSPARGGGRGRRAPQTDNTNTIIIVSVGVLVLVAVLAMTVNGGRGDSGDGGAEPAPAADSDSPAREASSPSTRPEPSTTGTEGKTPGRPAPPLTAATIDRWKELYSEAKGHYNDAQRARRDQDRAGVESAGRRAKESLEQMSDLLRDNLDWQEEAQLEGWAQPAEYRRLEHLFLDYSTLNKKVRMLIGS